MLLAGGLLALEKYMKWKIFNIVPPLVWIYIFNMFFCTIGLYNSDECSAAYSALKNNILYAMIFVMLLRCDFRKLGKLISTIDVNILVIFSCGDAPDACVQHRQRL